jgi:hypothetical protein
MTEETQSNVVSINGKDYNADEMNNEQKYAIQQLRDLQTKADSLKFQLDQVAAAQKVFTDALIASVETSEASVKDAVQAATS